MLNGCGGGSSTINENPTNGSGGATANGSCSVTNSDCLQFSLDYPIAGINFTCSSAANLSFVTKASGIVLSDLVKQAILLVLFARYQSYKKN